MTNHEEKDCHKKKMAGKWSENKVIEYVIYDKLFITKTSNQEHDKEIFIMDSGATSHLINSEENMTNHKDSEILSTKGDSRTLTKTKNSN